MRRNSSHSMTDTATYQTATSSLGDAACIWEQPAASAASSERVRLIGGGSGADRVSSGSPLPRIDMPAWSDWRIRVVVALPATGTTALGPTDRTQRTSRQAKALHISRVPGAAGVVDWYSDVSGLRAPLSPQSNGRNPMPYSDDVCVFCAIVAGSAAAIVVEEDGDPGCRAASG